jgi:hypothetical protein
MACDDMDDPLGARCFRVHTELLALAGRAELRGWHWRGRACGAWHRGRDQICGQTVT